MLVAVFHRSPAKCDHRRAVVFVLEVRTESVDETSRSVAGKEDAPGPGGRIACRKTRPLERVDLAIESPVESPARGGGGRAEERNGGRFAEELPARRLVRAPVVDLTLSK